MRRNYSLWPEVLVVGSLVATLGTVLIGGITSSNRQREEAIAKQGYDFDSDSIYRRLVPEFTNPNSRYFLGETGEYNPATGVGIIFDSSGSMAGERISAARRSTVRFLDRIRAEVEKGKDVDVGLMHFSGGKDGFVLERPVSNFNYQALADIVNRLNANGGTPLGLSTAGMERELRRGGYSRRFAIGFTDGDSETGEEPEYVIRGIVDSGSTTQIYWIGFDTEIPAKVQAAGARRLSAEDQPSLDRAFDEVFEEVMAEAPEIPHPTAPKEK